MSGHAGCKRPDRVARNKNRATHGMTNSPEFKSWQSAKARCTRPSNIGWKNYGGRGIEFRFKSFAEFYEHVGPRPAGMSLDRIDPNGHYEIGNVRWATYSEQIANRRKYSEISQFTDNELFAELARRGYAVE